MGLHVRNPNANAFVRTMRKVYNPIGFHKGYNFVLFFIFGGALFGFCLARLKCLSINHKFKNGAVPGEWYYYSRTFYKVGIALHLAAIVPCGLLAVLQFLPIIRYKALIFHRINGYVVVGLLVAGDVGALMIARYAFGGTLSTQCLVGVLAIITLGSALIAYYNIKVLQIDQHRAWMLRCFFYAGSIITLRVILVISAFTITAIGNYYIAMPCGKIDYIQAGTANKYAACRADPNGQAAVRGDFDPDHLVNLAASMDISFGMAGWLALAMHAVGVEVYLRLTPAESERLRHVSWERQTERGLAHPGSAGLTADKLGDAEKWTPNPMRVHGHDGDADKR